MKRYYPLLFIASILIGLMLMPPLGPQGVQAEEAPSPTPTYDPLVEPGLSENPTEYELGRNWYWHHCMPCHGDKGQGLTDEWRAAWVPDHQDCWGRGCHAGERLDDSFPIPTIVPPVVSSVKLSRFSSLQALYEYLKATHPPQYPGHLEDEQYHAIALFVFSMNHRPVEEFSPAPTSTPTIVPSSTHPPTIFAAPAETPTEGANLLIFAGLGVILIVALVWGIRKLRST